MNGHNLYTVQDKSGQMSFVALVVASNDQEAFRLVGEITGVVLDNEVLQARRIQRRILDSPRIVDVLGLCVEEEQND